MMASNSPEEYYEQLGADEREIVDCWEKKRTVLLQGMIAKSINDSLKDNTLTERSSAPYVKLLVKALCYSERSNDQRDRQQENATSISAEITFWRVSDEQVSTFFGDVLICAFIDYSVFNIYN